MDTILNSIPQNDKMKTMLKQLDTKEITMEEFNKECAYWFIACNDLKPQLLPTRPAEMLEYDTFTIKEKHKVEKSFWYQPTVSKYLNDKQRIKDRNMSILTKLREYKSYIPEGDTVTHSKYAMAINEYI